MVDYLEREVTVQMVAVVISTVLVVLWHSQLGCNNL